MATLLVNAGKAIVTNRIKGSGTEPVYVAYGTGAGTTAATDTTLFTETGSRVSGTSTQQTTSVTNDTYQVVGTQTAGGTLAITNAGLFDASTSGNLFVKGDFSTINLSSGDSIQFTFKTQFS
jgi:Tfp pilus assembly protein PilW